MKHLLVAFAVLSSLTISARAEMKSMAEQKAKVLIIKIRSYDKSISYQTMSPEEFKKFDIELKNESKLLPQAIELVGKEWKKDPQYKRKPFPGSQIAARQATAASPAMDEASAADKLARMQEQLSARLAEEAKKAAEAAKKAAEAAQKAGKEDDSKAKAERENLLTVAIDMVTAKLEELKANGGKPASAPAAEPAN